MLRRGGTRQRCSKQNGDIEGYHTLHHLTLDPRHAGSNPLQNLPVCACLPSAR